ncbi:hypothetical protein RFI_24121, partial [Reticulomyxa filosa]
VELAHFLRSEPMTMSIVRNRQCTQCNGAGKVKCTSNEKKARGTANQAPLEVVYAPEDIGKFGIDKIGVVIQERKFMERAQNIDNNANSNPNPNTTVPNSANNTNENANDNVSTSTLLFNDTKQFEVCNNCNGGGVTPTEALLVFHIQGKEHGHGITFPCQGDEVTEVSLYFFFNKFFFFFLRSSFFGTFVPFFFCLFNSSSVVFYFIFPSPSPSLSKKKKKDETIKKKKNK